MNWEAVSAFVQWDQTLPAGTQLRDYQIRGVIGESDYGIVYLAWDESLQRRVAIKEYLPRPLASRRQDSTLVECASVAVMPVFDAGLKAFVAEARVLARFSHPALVKVYRFWEDNGTAYMVMPHHEGPTLERALAQAARPQGEAEVRTWLRPVIDAVATMHAGDSSHLAIDPNNILLTPSGPLLLGFSAARRLVMGIASGAASAVSAGYAAPEQYLDASDPPPGPEADLYALAAVAWRALVGHAPLAASERLSDDRQPRLRDLVADRCSAAFADALDDALVLQPARRPPDHAAFRERLGGMEPLPATPISGLLRDLMSEPFGSDAEPAEVTVPIPTQPMPLPVVEAVDPMARPFAASTAPIPLDKVEPAAPVVRPAHATNEPRLSRRTILAIVGGVALLGAVAAGVLYRYAAPGASGAAASSENAASSAATAVAPTGPAPVPVQVPVPVPVPAPVIQSPPPESATTAAAVPMTTPVAPPVSTAPKTEGAIPTAAPTAAPTVAPPVLAPPVLAAPVLAAPSTAPKATPADIQPRPAGATAAAVAKAGRPIPIERPPISAAQRRSICGDLLQEATLRRLSVAEAAYFKKECR